MNIVVTGSVAYDYLMTFPGDFKEHILPDQLESISLSFLVDRMVKRRGGVAPNIAYNLALLGGNPIAFATVGEDFGDYRSWLNSKGVNTEYMKVVEGTFTASFFATTDQNNAQLASFYPGAMARATDISLIDLAERPDLVIISPNDPAAMDQYIDECITNNFPYVYDPSQQIVRVDGEVLKKGISDALALFVNEYEFELIKKKTNMAESAILGQVEFAVVTRGGKGVSIYHAGEEIFVDAFPTQNIVDPTGAGDAFRGGFLTGYARGWDWKTCGQLGTLTATYCLENDGPQGQSYTIEEFVARYRGQYDDEGLLDALLR